MRSSPHVRFAAAMSAISCCRSGGIRGRPRGFDLMRQKSRYWVRCLHSTLTRMISENTAADSFRRLAGSLSTARSSQRQRRHDCGGHRQFYVAPSFSLTLERLSFVRRVGVSAAMAAVSAAGSMGFGACTWNPAARVRARSSARA